MSSDEMRIAVAKLCGWDFVPSHDVQGKAYPEYWEDPEGFQHFGEAPFPNYIADLNACAKFEKTLSMLECFDYKRILYRLVNPNSEDAINSSMFIFGATAEQRCKAFLTVKGRL